MTVVDPCLTATISLISAPWPIGDQNDEIADLVTLPWTAAGMYSLSTSVDCGAFTVTFQQKASGAASYSTLDPVLFSVNQATE